MKLKRWVLGKASGRKRDAGTAVRPRTTPALSGERIESEDGREPTIRVTGHRDGLRPGVGHLGPYAPLIGAIRDELERFVADEVRLHLAIAERDRYVLMSIDIDCEGDDQHRELLRRFVGEFKPEQIKQYLAREVIAGLRNASAVDLGQFGGLNASAREGDANEVDDGYAELLAELRSSAPPRDAPPYRVTIVGRWSQLDAPAQASARKQANGHPADDTGAMHTPLAGRVFTFDIEDAGGGRSLELASVVPGRRYAIGKDEALDIVVDGLYASRRHCEIWYDKGAWWVIDTGSTNGIRVETPGASGSGRSTRPATAMEPVELPPGASLVLSANIQGEAREYPRLTLHSRETRNRGPGIQARTQSTPVTPIAAPRPQQAKWRICAHMASGSRESDVADNALPLSIGRSRNQALVIDWTHADVSGRHVEVVGIDDDGVSVVVHGDNGVTVDATAYGAGAQFRWKPGETMVLGGRTAETPACTLLLTRIGERR